MSPFPTPSWRVDTARVRAVTIGDTAAEEPAMEPSTTQRFVDDVWDRSIFPTIQEYIGIPNKSPAFDHEWEAHGHMERALELLVDWCQAQEVPGAKLSVERLPGRTPLIFLDVPGEGDDCIL